MSARLLATEAYIAQRRGMSPIRVLIETTVPTATVKQKSRWVPHFSTCHTTTSGRVSSGSLSARMAAWLGAPIWQLRRTENGGVQGAIGMMTSMPSGLPRQPQRTHHFRVRGDTVATRAKKKAALWERLSRKPHKIRGLFGCGDLQPSQIALRDDGLMILNELLVF